VEYNIIENNSDDFWEDKKNRSFGIKIDEDKNIFVKINKNEIIVESQGINAYLHRERKKAKISIEGKKAKGIIKNGDKLYLNNEVIIEFEEKKHKIKKISFPEINWNVWISILILTFLTLIIFFGWKKRTETNIENNYQKILVDIKDNIKKSEEIKSIDLETSLKLLNEVRVKISEIKSNKVHGEEIILLEKEINEKLASSGSNEIVSFEEIYNAKTADATDRNYDKIVVTGDDAVLVESNTKKIIKVNLISGQVSKTEINLEINNIIDISLVNKNIYVYDGQYIFMATNQAEKVANLESEVFLKIINWNNSWYLLGQEGKISKFNDNKISNWTLSGATLIDKPISMAIDGTVWVIDVNGNVINYEKGLNKKWTPSIKFVNEKIKGITTTIDSDTISVITDKKIYVFEKSGGKLLASHNFEKIGIIDAKMGSNKQIYVLGTDQKIYKVK
jgi:hypothetical protein